MSHCGAGRGGAARGRSLARFVSLFFLLALQGRCHKVLTVFKSMRGKRPGKRPRQFFAAAVHCCRRPSLSMPTPPPTTTTTTTTRIAFGAQSRDREQGNYNVVPVAENGDVHSDANEQEQYRQRYYLRSGSARAGRGGAGRRGAGLGDTAYGRLSAFRHNALISSSFYSFSSLPRRIVWHGLHFTAFISKGGQTGMLPTIRALF